MSLSSILSFILFYFFFSFEKKSLPDGPCCDTSLTLRHLSILTLAASGIQNELDGLIQAVPDFITILAKEKG